ncbi:MAG: chalcone isomerase family protein [Candidatus Sericytochromatia bacterium]
MKSSKILLGFILILVTITPSFSMDAKKIKFEKRDYSQNKRVKLVGSGYRVKYFFDVYSIAFYSESGKCDRKDLISSKEAKKIKIVILRDIERKRFMGTIIEVFNQQVPTNSPEILKEQVQKFNDLLFRGQEKVKKGDVYFFDYIPNKALYLYENSQLVGSINSATDAFMSAFLSIWLGDNSCCPDTLKQIMKCNNK